MARFALLFSCLLVVGCIGTVAPEPVECGDGVCSALAESCTTCPADCGECAVCGDGACDPGVETCSGCPGDCGECGTCGDGTCNASVETCSSCPADCAECDTCGDGICASDSESCTSCPADCGACESCGDGTCDATTESCAECAQDCGKCPTTATCGDGTCTAAAGEDCSSCPGDCGACPHCGNGTCELAEAETCATCPGDCGACKACGNDVCEGPAETCSTCPADCGRCNPCGDGVCKEATEDCTSCPADCGACTVRKGCVQGKFSAYLGNLHAHTSYSDGQLTPAQAFQHAKGAGLDFMTVTDHKGQMSDAQWDACKAQANASNNPGTFVAGCGYEIVIPDLNDIPIGHINFLFATRRTSTPKGLEDLYSTLAGCDGCLGQWNHPPWPGTFGNYRFYPTGKPSMRLIEFSGRGDWSAKMDAYFTALRNGWRVSPSNNEDNHQQNWGDTKRATGIWAADLSRSGVREAVDSNRTFATQDDTATLSFKADDVCWMGSVLHRIGPIDFTVVARDRQNGDGFKRLELRGKNGGVLESKACNGSNPCMAKFSRTPSASTFWVVTASQQDGDILVSAPIWLEP